MTQKKHSRGLSSYPKGYAAGLRKEWPEHKPPLPPHALVQKLVIAASELRDEADAVCARLDCDDVSMRPLSDKVDALDKVMVTLTAWLTTLTGIVQNE